MSGLAVTAKYPGSTTPGLRDVFNGNYFRTERGWKLTALVKENDMYVYYFQREIFQIAYLNDGEVMEVDIDEYR